MNYSDIKKHIINKQDYWFCYILILVSLLLGFFSCYHSIWALLIFWLTIMATGCILINYYRCRSFYKLYKNALKEYNVQLNRVFIEKDAYKISVPYKSSNVINQPFKKQTNAVYLETNDFLLLFLSARYLETIQLLLNPFVFIKSEKLAQKIYLCQNF